MLRSLLRCGLDGWHVHVALEPGAHQSENAALCEALLPEGQVTLVRNRERLGVRRNPFNAVSRAFESGARFNLNLEEDFLLSPDALQLAAWYRDNHKPHWAALNLLAGTCGSAGNLSLPDHPALVFESRCFNSIGVGLTASDWHRLRDAFEGKAPWDCYPFEWGWDWAIYAQILLTPELRVLHPLAARCTHVGAHGTHCLPEFQGKAFERLAPSTRDRLPPGTEGFHLTRIADLPPTAAAHIYSQDDAATLRHEILTRAGVTLPGAANGTAPTSATGLAALFARAKSALGKN
jgi:hypothetical protein